jgi:adenylosuccinate synthase
LKNLFSATPLHFATLLLHFFITSPFVTSLNTHTKDSFVEMGAGPSRKIITLGSKSFSVERVLGKGAFGKVHVIVVCI